MIGSTVDKYEVLQKVGEGGMATVYRGRHTTLDREVAIKVLHPHLSSSTRNRKRFAREARAIEHLRHDNILEIFDYSGIDSGDCYIITEFVDGQTLTALLEEHGRLPSELVSIIGIKLCEALGYAHESGILHRDMKPDNVMVRSDGTIKLMDFGIARFLDETQVTLTGALVGSPAFMSPEQAVEADLDTRSDLFSLGTVLFYLVAGELPFTGSNPSLILKNVIEGNRPHVAELVPSIAPELADVIERLMATSPEGRFNTASEVAEALEAGLAMLGIAPMAESWRVERFLEDPSTYVARLDAFVADRSLVEGRSLLERGEALGALRLFNRLLAIDEDNEEVLELVASLHAEPERRRTGVGFGLGVAVAILILGALGMALLGPPLATETPQTPASPNPVQPDQPTAPPPRPAPPTAPAPAPPIEPEPAVAAPTPRPVPAPRPFKPTLRIEQPIVAVPVPEPLPERDGSDDEGTPIPSGPGTLRVVSNMAADIYASGRKLGSTRLPLELEPGAYVLEIRSDVVKPYELRVEVAPGEAVERVVTLEARPATVRLSNAFAADCQVSVDGAPIGTVSGLEGTLEIPRPNQHGHRVTVTCGSDDPFEHVFSGVVLPGQVVGP